MRLTPILDHPHLYRNTATGAVVNMHEYGPMDVTYPWSNGNVQLRAGEYWILENWSVVLHPFPEVIHPSITVMFAVNDLIWSEVPLFTIAEPLAGSEAFEHRAKRLEEALGKAGIEGRALKIEEIAGAMLGMFHRNEAGQLKSNMLLGEGGLTQVEMKTRGPQEVMSVVDDAEHFLFRLQGKRRRVIT